MTTVNPEVVQSANNSVNISVVPSDVIYWPRWVKYIAWALCATVSLVAAFFTLLYGLSFGKLGQEKWLFSFFFSVFTDIIFNQPIKVNFFLPPS